MALSGRCTEKKQSIVIDINCDMGEGETIADCNKDAQLMPFISSCNIACGGHAGSELTIRNSLINAKRHQLKIGAHPGYPDKENFGRSTQYFSHEQLKNTLRDQLDLFLDIAKQENITVHHIKLHGALYNDVEKRPELALYLSEFFLQYYPSFKISGLAGGEMEHACNKKGVTFVPEGFIDRTYLSNGKLTPRTQPGAIIRNPEDCIKQAIALAKNHSIITSDGKTVSPRVETLCLHGDNPDAIDIIGKLILDFRLSGIFVQ